VIDFFSLAVQRMHGQPPEWQWCKLDANMPEDFILIEGAVPVGVVRSGKRKGSPKWPAAANRSKHYVRKSFVDSLKEEWEAVNGICSSCEGSGSSKACSNGKCFRCKGTGKPNTQEVAEHERT
jgi:hypothetical protein